MPAWGWNCAVTAGPTDMKSGRKSILALICLAAAGVGRLAAPDFPGFSVLPLAVGLILAIWAGPAEWRRLGAGLTGPAGRTRIAAALVLILSLAALLAVGRLSRQATFDFSPERTLALAPETMELLDRLDRPVSLTIHLGPQSPRLPRVRELMKLYERAGGGRLTISYVNPQTEAADGPRLVAPDSALFSAEGFRENVAPVTEESLNGALTRLLHPENRLVYFLNTFGEKMVQDRGPGGLSQWAEDLSARRLLAQDYYWPEGAPLPPEASALVLAGPRAPLGELREKLLLTHLKNGGKILIMVDPLTVALAPEFWRPFGLSLPDGLVVDPEANLAGTSDSFVVSQDYPAHALTRGLSGPTVWPLTGAFNAAADGRAELAGAAYALVQSSPSSWLETDPVSFADGSYRYQAEIDQPGPLTLAVAVELADGGRLVALADSDLAANGFRGFAGNRRFTSAAVHWLLDGDLAPSPTGAPPQALLLNPIIARLIFWLPTLAWPSLVLGLWALFRWRRHRRAEFDS